MSHSCDETYDVYEERYRTAIKSHSCDACGLPIRKGDRYTTIAIVFDGRAERVKRCLRCQAIHEHLRDLAPGEMWPDERLNCGTLYRHEWDRSPPAWLEALAFWNPGEPLPPTNPCLVVWGSAPVCQDRWFRHFTARIYGGGAHAAHHTEPCS